MLLFFQTLDTSCLEFKKVILVKETIEHVAKLFEEHGSVIWWERDAKDLLPEGFTHPGSPNGEFTKETDIMDVWIVYVVT